MRPKNSTNVRMFSALVHHAPMLGAPLLGELFLTAPPRLVPTEAEARVLGEARAFEVTTDAGVVHAWAWEPAGSRGPGVHRPRVLLVHGHGGAASQMTPLVGALLARGHSVVAYDAPGHGASPGRHSSLVRMARALAGVADPANGAGPFAAVVAHSLGGAAVCLAARYGARFDRAVLIAPPSDMRAWFDRFTTMFALDAVDAARVADVVERRVGVPMSELRAEALGPHLAADTLVIHDRADKEVAFASGEAVVRSIARARMQPTEGLGHRRILRDRAVAEAASTFAAPDTHRPRMRGALERTIGDELFNPEMRLHAAFG